jgi:hypothetical protein
MLDIRTQQSPRHDFHGQGIHLGIEADTAAGVPGRGVTGRKLRARRRGASTGAALQGRNRPCERTGWERNWLSLVSVAKMPRQARMRATSRTRRRAV